MEERYSILKSGGTGEIIEKKSRFIATIQSVETEEEAQAFITKMKKQYWDAKHNCSAYVIGSRGEITRCSDDGEPSQTAGRPMLEVLQGSGIRNIAVVVTRYFGGVLLGTGGLVRAYQAAVKEGLKNCEVQEIVPGDTFQIHTDYTGLGKVQYILSAHAITPSETKYESDVVITVFLPKELQEGILSEITEGTAGKAKWEKE